jgi:hypothetical protein
VVAPRQGLTTGGTVVASGTTYYVPASGGALVTSAPGTPRWVASAGDLLIVTLHSGNASASNEFTSPSLADNIGTNGGLNPWNVLVPLSTYSSAASPRIGSVISWWKVAVGGEDAFTPTFTQTTHTHNTLTVDCSTGWIGAPALDPAWTASVFLGTLGLAGTAATSAAMYALPDTPTTSYVPQEFVYGWVGLANGVTAPTISATGITGSTPAISAAGSLSISASMVSSASFTGAFLSTGILNFGWTNSQINVVYGVTFYDTGTIIPAATITAKTSGTRTLTATAALTSETDSVSTLVGSPALPVSPIAGSIDTTSSLTGTISAIAPLATGSNDLTSGVQGQGVQGGQIQGGAGDPGNPSTITASFGLTGTISVIALLGATTSANAGLSGTVSAGASPPGATMAVRSTLTGTITAAAVLPSTTIASTTGLSGTPNCIVALTGSISAATGLSGTLSTVVFLTGTIAASSGLTGASSASANLSGATIASTSGLAGASSATAVIPGATIGATSGLTGTPNCTAAMSGVIAAASGQAGTLSALAPLVTVTVAASTSVSGTVTRALFLTGTIGASAGLAGVIEAETWSIVPAFKAQVRPSVFTAS